MVFVFSIERRSAKRERRQQKFKSRTSAQRFLATHAAVYILTFSLI
jgi:hypothetical protein